MLLSRFKKLISRRWLCDGKLHKPVVESNIPKQLDPMETRKDRNANYFLGATIMSVFYALFYSYFNSKSIYIEQYPPIPRSFHLVKDTQMEKRIRSQFFNRFTRIYDEPMALVGLLGSGKSTVLYQVCKEIYKKPSSFDIRLPYSKICVFIDATSSVTFWESVRSFLLELNIKCRNETLDPFSPEIISLPPEEQSTKLLQHMFALLENHSNYCIVLDNINKRSFKDLETTFKRFFDPFSENSRKISGKIIYVFDSELPMFETNNFIFHEGMTPKASFELIKSMMGIPELEESHVNEVIELLGFSPIAVISAAMLMKVQMKNKRHLSVAEADKLIANSVSFVMDKLSKRNNCDINSINFNHIATLTVLSMFMKSYICEKQLSFDSKFPFDKNVSSSTEQEALEFESLINAACFFPTATRLPELVILVGNNGSHSNNYRNKTHETNNEKNKTDETNNDSFFEIVRNVINDLKKFQENQTLHCSLKPDEKVDKRMHSNPFILFSKTFEQNNLSIHPLIHEASRNFLESYSFMNISRIYEEKLRADSFYRGNPSKIRLFIQKIKKTQRDDSIESFYSNPTLIKQLKKLKDQLIKVSFKTTPVTTMKWPENNLKLERNESLMKLYGMFLTLNALSSVITTPVLIRHGYWDYNCLKRISLMQHILHQIENTELHIDYADRNTLHNEITFIQTKITNRVSELMIKLRYPLNDTLNILSEHILKFCPLHHPSGKTFVIKDEKSELIASLHLNYIHSLIMSQRFDQAQESLQVLWPSIDPATNFMKYPKLSSKVIYLGCMLLKNHSNFTKQNNNLKPESINEDDSSLSVKDVDVHSDSITANYQSNTKLDERQMNQSSNLGNSSELLDDDSASMDKSNQFTDDYTLKEVSLKPLLQQSLAKIKLTIGYLLQAYQIQMIACDLSMSASENSPVGNVSLNEEECTFLLEIMMELAESISEIDLVPYSLKYMKFIVEMHNKFIKNQIETIKSPFDKRIQELLVSLHSKNENLEMVNFLKLKQQYFKRTYYQSFGR